MVQAKLQSWNLSFTEIAQKNYSTPRVYAVISAPGLGLLLSFIMPNGSTDKNTIIDTKYKNTFTKQNIKTDYKLRLQFILY